MTTTSDDIYVDENDNIIIPGDSNYDYDTDNQEAGPMDGTSQTYLDLVMDMNMCMVEVIYKYDLSDAVKETKEIVDNDDWIISIRQADGDRSLEILAETMTPIARDLLNVTGAELVNSMPPEILAWFVDSAVVFAVQQGTITQEEG